MRNWPVPMRSCPTERPSLRKAEIPSCARDSVIIRVSAIQNVIL